MREAPKKYRGHKDKYNRRRNHQRQQRQRKLDALDDAVKNSRISKSTGEPHRGDLKKNMANHGYLPTGRNPLSPSGWKRTAKLTPVTTVPVKS